MQQTSQKVVGHVRRLSQNTKIRFILAGITNTVIDVGCFNILVLVFSLGVIPATIASTTIAMAASYLINKKAVFRNKTPHSFRQMALFLLVTATGIWLVQTLILVEVLNLLKHIFSPADQSFLLWFLQNVAKGVGIVFGAVWSWFGYSRLVFRQNDLQSGPSGSSVKLLEKMEETQFSRWTKTIGQHWYIWVLVAMAVTFALALWIGTKQSVWFDEAYSLTLAKQSYGHAISLTAVDVHPPLYYLLLKLWVSIFGFGDIALRSLGALLGALGVGVGLLLVKRLFGLRTLLVSTPFVVLAPYLLRYAFEIRMYALASLIGVAATYVLVRAIQSKHAKWWIIYSVLVALGMYTLYYMAFIWIAHIIWLLYLRRTQGSSIKLSKEPWVRAYIGSIVLYIPWIPTFIEQYRSPALSGISQRVSWEQITDIFSFMFIYKPHWELHSLGIIGVWTLIVAFVYVVIRAFKRAGDLKPYLMLLLLYFVVPALILAIGSLPPLRPLFLVRYTSHFIIAGSLLLGASLCIAFRQQLRYIVIGTAVVTGILIYGVANLNHTGNFNFETLTRPHANKVGEVLNNVCNSNSIVLSGSPLHYFEIEFYLPNCDIRFYSDYPIGSGGGYATIYQSPKQYYPGDPIAQDTVYYLYVNDDGKPPIDLPSDFVPTASQSFEKYHLVTYEREP